MGYSWFPGHMKKSLNELETKIRLVDLVVEVIDARAPFSSRNLELQKIIKNKKYLIVLTKMDLADPVALQKQIKQYNSHGIEVVSLNKSMSVDVIKKMVIKEMKEKIVKNTARGIKNTVIRIMIVGVPNVGKSTLINRLAKGNKAKVENRPGVTRGFTFIKIGDNLEALDSPGLLWPAITSDEQAYKLMLLGTIKNEVIDYDNCANFLVEYLKKNYPNNLVNRYQINVDSTAEEILLEIGKNRGVLIKNNQVDLDSVKKLIIKEYNSGMLGRISLDE